MTSDIGNIGTAYKILGKISGYFYEGLLFSKDRPLGSTLEGRNFVVDVFEISETEVKNFGEIYVVQENEIPFEKLQGPYILVIEGRPRFGSATLIEDIKGLR